MMGGALKTFLCRVKSGLKCVFQSALLETVAFGVLPSLCFNVSVLFYLATTFWQLNLEIGDNITLLSLMSATEEISYHSVLAVSREEYSSYFL